MTSRPRSLAASIIAAVALANVPASAAVPIPICVVIRDYAAVPGGSRVQAIQIVADAYRPLGIGVVWMKSPVCAEMTTIHLSILPRTARGEGSDRIIGVDAPSGLEADMHLAHILFRRIGGDRVRRTWTRVHVAPPISAGLRSQGAAQRPKKVSAAPTIARRIAEPMPVFN